VNIEDAAADELPDSTVTPSKREKEWPHRPVAPCGSGEPKRIVCVPKELKTESQHSAQIVRSIRISIRMHQHPDDAPDATYNQDAPDDVQYIGAGRSSIDDVQYIGAGRHGGAAAAGQ
jgi:hypothetical protein